MAFLFLYLAVRTLLGALVRSRRGLHVKDILSLRQALIRIERVQRAVPMLSYEDVVAAIDWLAKAFGFREQGMRHTDTQGRVTHAELGLDGAVVMLGWPGPDYRSPARHAEDCEQARRWLATPWVVDGVLVSVEDVDRHCERAKAAGATILRELDDQPFGRLYSAVDLEGHRWMFLQPTA